MNKEERVDIGSILLCKIWLTVCKELLKIDFVWLQYMYGLTGLLHVDAIEYRSIDEDYDKIGGQIEIRRLYENDADLCSQIR